MARCIYVSVIISQPLQDFEGYFLGTVVASNARFHGGFSAMRVAMFFNVFAMKLREPHEKCKKKL